MKTWAPSSPYDDQRFQRIDARRTQIGGFAGLLDGVTAGARVTADGTMQESMEMEEQKKRGAPPRPEDAQELS